MSDSLGTCVICLSDLGDDQSLLQTWGKCGHTYHKACLCGWLMQNKKSCPTCREKLDVADSTDEEDVSSESSDSESESSDSESSESESSSSDVSESSHEEEEEKDLFLDDVELTFVPSRDPLKDVSNDDLTVFMTAHASVNLLKDDALHNNTNELFNEWKGFLKKKAVLYRSLTRARDVAYSKLGTYMKNQLAASSLNAKSPFYIRKKTHSDLASMKRFLKNYDFCTMEKYDKEWFFLCSSAAGLASDPRLKTWRRHKNLSNAQVVRIMNELKNSHMKVDDLERKLIYLK